MPANVILRIIAPRAKNDHLMPQPGKVFGNAPQVLGRSSNDFVDEKRVDGTHDNLHGFMNSWDLREGFGIIQHAGQPNFATYVKAQRPEVAFDRLEF